MEHLNTLNLHEIEICCRSFPLDHHLLHQFKLQQTWLFQKIQVHKGDVIIFVQNYKPTFKLSARDQTFLRCFDTVFRRPYTRYYSITLKVVISSLFNRYEIFTTDWSWIKVCPNVVLNKIDVSMKTINIDTRNLKCDV